MGLDITWYRELEARPDAEVDEDGYPVDDELTTFYLNDDFPGREDQVRENVAYAAADSDGFHAGSYSGYNMFRNQLAKLAGVYPGRADDEPLSTEIRYDKGAWERNDGPFWELINFSDCEGVIGASVAAKLAQDFTKGQALADASNDEHFQRRYANWRHAFEQAAHNGAVSFH